MRYYRNAKIFTGADETTFVTAFAVEGSPSATPTRRTSPPTSTPVRIP